MLSETFIDERLAVTDSDALRMLIVLKRITPQKRTRSMSYDELAQRGGIDPRRAKDAIQRLADSGDVTFEKNVVTLDHGELVYKIKLTADKAETFDALVEENKALRRAVEEGANVGFSFSDKIGDEPARVVRVAENLMARPLIGEEIFYLSELIARYGPERVLSSLKVTAKYKEPLRSTYVRLKRGAVGKEMNQQASAIPSVSYAVLDDVDPWGK